MFYKMRSRIWVRDVELKGMMGFKGLGCRIRAVGPRAALIRT